MSDSKTQEDVETAPSEMATSWARDFIAEHYGYGPPSETVRDLAVVLERYAAEQVSMAVDVCNEIQRAERAKLLQVAAAVNAHANGRVHMHLALERIRDALGKPF